MSLGCCDGGGPFGKRPEFEAGEKVGEAREPVAQTLRLGRRVTLRSTYTGDRVGDEGRIICQRRTAGSNRAYPSSAACSDGLKT